MSARDQIARQRAILAHYAAGTPLKIIAQVYGVSLSYPTQLAKRRGVVRGSKDRAA